MVSTRVLRKPLVDMFEVVSMLYRCCIVYIGRRQNGIEGLTVTEDDVGVVVEECGGCGEEGVCVCVCACCVLCAGCWLLLAEAIHTNDTK